jgi:hypothetical protein
MGELGALFNPGMRHELEERQAKAARREEEGNARDGDLRIDLESGVAVINVVGTDSDEAGTDTTPGAEVSEPAAGADASAAKDTAAGHPVDNDTAGERSTDDHTTAEAAASTGAESRPTAPAVKPRGKRGLSHSAR